MVDQLMAEKLTGSVPRLRAGISTDLRGDCRIRLLVSCLEAAGLGKYCTWRPAVRGCIDVDGAFVAIGESQQKFIVVQAATSVYRANKKTGQYDFGKGPEKIEWLLSMGYAVLFVGTRIMIDNAESNSVAERVDHVYLIDPSDHAFRSKLKVVAEKCTDSRLARLGPGAADVLYRAQQAAERAKRMAEAREEIRAGREQLVDSSVTSTGGGMPRSSRLSARAGSAMTPAGGGASGAGGAAGLVAFLPQRRTTGLNPAGSMEKHSWNWVFKDVCYDLKMGSFDLGRLIDKIRDIALSSSGSTRYSSSLDSLLSSVCHTAVVENDSLMRLKSWVEAPDLGGEYKRLESVGDVQVVYRTVIPPTPIILEAKYTSGTFSGSKVTASVNLRLTSRLPLCPVGPVLGYFFECSKEKCAWIVPVSALSWDTPNGVVQWAATHLTFNEENRRCLESFKFDTDDPAAPARVKELVLKLRDAPAFTGDDYDYVVAKLTVKGVISGAHAYAEYVESGKHADAVAEAKTELAFAQAAAVTAADSAYRPSGYRKGSKMGVRR